MQATVPLPYRPVIVRHRQYRPSKAVYRRRRVAVLLCAAALVALGWPIGVMGLHRLTNASGGGPLTAAGRPVSVLDATLATHSRVIVQPGDTLWSIARRVQPTGDLRPLVSSLEAQRHGRALQVGETIEI